MTKAAEPAQPRERITQQTKGGNETARLNSSAPCCLPGSRGRFTWLSVTNDGRDLSPPGVPGFTHAVYNRAVPASPSNSRLERVLAQLRLYEHPLLAFDAQAKNDAVEVVIQFKDPPVPVHTYYFDLHPRDLDHPQFEWSFQRQLYDCLHDYLIEMFTRTPQNRTERQRENL